MRVQSKRNMGVLVFVIATLITTLVFSIVPAYGAVLVDITVNRSKVVGSNKLSLGFQLNDDWRTFLNSPTVRQEAKDGNFKLVRFLSTVVEPCTSWNEGTKTGAFNWANVDSLVQRIFEVGAEPLVAIGRIKSGGGGIVIPPGMAVNPTTGLPYPDSYAAYAVQWVRHFKSLGLPVKYYEIVNEPFSYFGWTPDLTKLGNYLQLFNAVAKSMRQESSNLKISFDFICRQPVLDYWLSHGGAELDSLNFHKYDEDKITPYTSDTTMFNRAESQHFGQWPFGYSITQVQQKYYQARGKLLPIINSESNFNGAWATGTDPRVQQMAGAVWLALVLRMDVLNGVSDNVYFCLTSSQSFEQKKQTGGYGLGMINSDNAKPWYPYYVQQLLGNNLAVGDQIVEVTSSSSDIRSLGWIHGGKVTLLLICKTSTLLDVRFQGLQGTLNFSKIDNTISWQSPRVQTGSIDSAASISLKGYTVILLQAGDPTSSVSFKDGFESGTFGVWTGIGTTSGEAAAIVNTVKRSGTYGARLTSNGNRGFESAYCYENVASSSDLYARGYFYVTASGISSNDNRFYFTILQAGSNSVAYAGWRMVGGVVRWNLLVRDGSGYVSVSSTSSPSLNRWYSVELHWKEGSSNGLGELFVDGTLVCSISSKNTAYYGEVNRVKFGLSEIYNCAPTQVYGDDCAISSTYIGR